MKTILKEINAHKIYKLKDREKEKKIYDTLEEYDSVSYLLEIVEEMNCLLYILYEEFANSDFVVDSVKYYGDDYMLYLENYYTGEKYKVFVEE